LIIRANVALKDAMLLCAALTAASRGRRPVLKAIHDYESGGEQDGGVEIWVHVREGGCCAQPVRAELNPPLWAVMFAFCSGSQHSQARGVGELF